MEGEGESGVLHWAEEEPQELMLDQIRESYARYRLHVPEAERVMMRSLESYGQIWPVVVCIQEGRTELIDGFKRLGAARKLGTLNRFSARRIETDERGAKAGLAGSWWFRVQYYVVNCKNAGPQLNPCKRCRTRKISCSWKHELDQS